MSWDEELAGDYELWSAGMTADIPFYVELARQAREQSGYAACVMEVLHQLVAGWKQVRDDGYPCGDRVELGDRKSVV